MDEKPSRWNRMMELVERRFGFRTAQRVASGIDPSGAEKLGKTLMEVSIKRDGDVIASQNAPWRVWDETRTRPSGAGDDWHCAQEGRSRPRESRPKQRADVGRRENKDTTWKRQQSESGAFHSSVDVWPADPNKHGLCARRREVYIVLGDGLEFLTTLAFWLRSSVVSVLNSLTTIMKAPPSLLVI